MRRELASIPPQTKPEPSAAVAKPSPSAADADIQAARQAVDQARQVLRQAQANQRAAFAARGQELQVELLAAQSPPPASLPPRFNANLVGKALVTATTSLVGLGMVSLGRITGTGDIEPFPVAGPSARAHCRRHPGHLSGPPLRIGLAPASGPLRLGNRRAGRIAGGRLAHSSWLNGTSQKKVLPAPFISSLPPQRTRRFGSGSGVTTSKKRAF